MSEPVAGNHNDLYNIEVQFEVVTGILAQANVSVDGLFLNADAGLDSRDFRQACAKKEINGNICFNKRNGDKVRHPLLPLHLTMYPWLVRGQHHLRLL